MNLSRFCVQRPVLTTMASLIVIVLGGLSLSRLSVDLMPDISYPTLSVMTRYEYASPEEVEELITRPIEEAMAAVPGVEEIASSSSEGGSHVTINFAWGTDLDVAANDVRDRLDRVIRRLPDDADRPILRKFDPAAFPILILGASSRLDPIEMRRLIDDEISQRIERIPGVAALDVWGGHQREIHVDVDPEKLQMVGLPMEQLVQRIRAANITMPAGFIEEGQYEFTMRVPGQFQSLDELRNTIVARRAGVGVRLSDVAEVRDHWRRMTRIVRMNRVPGVRLSISRQSEENTVDVARRVLREVERINRDMPQIRLIPIVDTSEFIQRAIANVASAAIFGGLFTLLVLMLFLRSIRSTAIIAVAIPLSIVGTFVLVYFSGFTLNIMTLGGLALGVGMLVDNSIVVLENIHRKLEGGNDSESSAVDGAAQVSAAIIASTLTTLAVFLPLIFIRGMAGVLFRQLAFVVSFALLSSLVAALTLIPMLSARFLRPSRKSTRGAPAGRKFKNIEDSYKRLLDRALSHRPRVVAAAVVLFGASLLFIPLVGTEFMPSADEGEVRVNVELETGTRLAVTDRIFEEIEEIAIREVPEIQNMVASVGGSPRPGRPGGSHLANLRISLKPRAERRRSSEEIAAVLRRALSDVPGIKLRVRSTHGLFMMRRMAGGDEQLELEIRGHDLEMSALLASQVLDIVSEIEGVTDARISREMGMPERLIRVDREKAESMGISISQAAELLQTAMTGARAGLYREAGNEIDIRVRLEDAERRPLREILDLVVMNPDGDAVALRNIVAADFALGPTQIDRLNQERLVSVHGNIAGRDMGSIVADVQAAISDLPVPPGFMLNIGGDYEEQREAFNELAAGLILALLLVYMVMACLYESLRAPFIVMFSVPLAVIGVILMLLLTGTTFNVQSFIGCIMLGGIVVNNAILLVDTANDLRRNELLDLKSAIAEAGRRRLRPILMTALTTICGLFPLALGLGEGGEMQAPMARAVIGGLLSATFVNLVFLPVVYTFFEKKDGGRNAGRGIGNGVKATVCILIVGMFTAGCGTVPSEPENAKRRASFGNYDSERGSNDETEAANHELGPLRVTSTDAVLMGLEQNRALRVVRFEPAIRREQEAIERSVFDPVLSLDVSERRARRETSDDPEETVGEEGTGLYGDISFLLPFGTSIGIESDLDRARRGDDERFSARLGLAARQPILRGAGYAVNMARLEKSRLDTRLSEYEVRGVAESLAAQVESAYWEYSLALQRIEMVDESLRLAKRQLEETRKRISVGQVPATEKAAAETEVALRREAQIDAAGSAEILHVRLLRLIAPERLRSIDAELSLVGEVETWEEDDLDRLEQHIESALLNRPDINQARLQVKIGEIEMVRTSNGLLPRMDVFLGLGKTGYSDSFGSAFAGLDGDGYDAIAGLGFEWPAANRAARARHRQAEWGYEQVLESLNNLKDLICEDVRIAYVTVLSAREQIQAKASTRKLQEETVRAESAKFAAGKTTALMVAHAQRELLGARVAEAEAVIQYRRALVNLYRLDGTLLMRRGILAPGVAR